MTAGKTKKKFRDPLRIIDMTVIPLCLAKFNWAKFRTTKGAVKLHMKLDGDNLFPINAYLTDGTVHEKNRMEHLTDESDVIYVMDRGFIDYKSLYGIELRDSVFVTRMKNNCKYKVVKINKCENPESVLSDVLIQFSGPMTKKYYPKQLRKIKYKAPDTGKVYQFLTNDLSRKALDIAGIYKERWEVELFFKWIKQHLKIKSFYGTSRNAVYNQIWSALILTVLIWISRTLDGIAVSAYELLIMMKSTLFTKTSISGLCTNIPHVMLVNNSSQLVFDGF